MSIHESQLANLRTIGYTEVEARFLYLVARHSGYFTVRQFLDFARARSGKRNARLVEKLFGLGHASARRYRRRSMVYHLHSRPLYDAIGKGDLRNRRGHELGYIKARLLPLDYILANPEHDYFETAEAKRQYSLRRFGISESLFLSSREHGKGITFADRFPLRVAYGNTAANNSGCSTENPPSNQLTPSGGGTCAGDIRLIQEGTLGFWHKFYQGPKGGVRWGIQYSYITKTGWSGASSIAPKAIDNMVWTSFRYYLP